MNPLTELQDAFDSLQAIQPLSDAELCESVAIELDSVAARDARAQSSESASIAFTSLAFAAVTAVVTHQFNEPAIVTMIGYLAAGMMVALAIIYGSIALISQHAKKSLAARKWASSISLHEALQARPDARVATAGERATMLEAALASEQLQKVVRRWDAGGKPIRLYQVKAATEYRQAENVAELSNRLHGLPAAARQS